MVLNLLISTIEKEIFERTLYEHHKSRKVRVFAGVDHNDELLYSESDERVRKETEPPCEQKGGITKDCPKSRIIEEPPVQCIILKRHQYQHHKDYENKRVENSFVVALLDPGRLVKYIQQR